jgi:Carbohydrate-binding family 9
MEAVPHRIVPHAGPHLAPVLRWEEIAPLPPLVRTVDGGPAEQPTVVRIAWNGQGLHIRFECQDRHAWGTMTRRDDPIYQEEAVEVFLAPGSADPVDYLEFEVSPLGVLWDGRIRNPTSRRADMVADPAWDCSGIRWAAGRLGSARQDWWASLSLPWEGIAPGESPPPAVWRANFYRIERPAGGLPEFTAWSPTLVEPADFHKPSRFGMLELASSLASS